MTDALVIPDRPQSRRQISSLHIYLSKHMTTIYMTLQLISLTYERKQTAWPLLLLSSDFILAQNEQEHLLLKDNTPNLVSFKLLVKSCLVNLLCRSHFWCGLIVIVCVRKET